MIPFTDVRDAGALLQRAGFALPVADVETVTVRYDNLFGLMADLRAMGAANALEARSRRPATRTLFPARRKSMRSAIRTRTGASGQRFRWYGCRAGRLHPSQQKPLKPGSAQVSLARILGGEKGR